MSINISIGSIQHLPPLRSRQMDLILPTPNYDVGPCKFNGLSRIAFVVVKESRDSVAGEAKPDGGNCHSALAS